MFDSYVPPENSDSVEHADKTWAVNTYGAFPPA